MELTQLEKDNLLEEQFHNITEDRKELDRQFGDWSYAASNTYIKENQKRYYKAQGSFVQESPAYQVTEEGTVEYQAPEATTNTDTRTRTKKEKKYLEANDKIREQYRTYRAAAAKVLEHDTEISGNGVSETISQKEFTDRRKLLNEEIKSISLFRQSAILQAQIEGRYEDESIRTRIDWKAQADLARAYGRFCRALPLNSNERALAMEAKEKAEIKAASLKKEHELSKPKNKAEREREDAHRFKHGAQSVLRYLRSRFPSKVRALSKEDKTYRVSDVDGSINGHLFVNTGRAHMGGTKPMYMFEDRTETADNNSDVGYKEYLYKEAVNCCGLKNPEGALVTESASKLQEKIRPGKAIKAFAVRQGGNVIGSFQEKVDVMDKHAKESVDLFSWQANPRDDLSDNIKNEILEEHAVDWVLCNFDTKGENFLQKDENTLLGSDKEASLKYLFSPEAQEMSTTYRPHTNDTLYNVLFDKFARGEIDLNLNTAMNSVKRFETMTNDEFLQMMEPALETKFGHGKKLEKAKELLLSRKTNLRKSYGTFFANLIHQRQLAVGKKITESNNAEELGELAEIRLHEEELLHGTGDTRTFIFSDERARLQNTQPGQ